ncbi:MAG: hypothetical protein JST76_14220, partial [Bacteroidetes bacterium]|nr:hypothetical protein [Bacteroidota bacterium]
WHHTFDNTNFSSKEFYTTLEAAAAARKIPSVRMSRVTYEERFVIGAWREYVRVARGQYVFDVCAAPFGTGMYVSWWLVEETTWVRRLLRRLPVISAFMGVKTYHGVDTEMMFRDLVHLAVMEAIDAVTSANGLRALGGGERAVQDYRNVRIAG